MERRQRMGGTGKTLAILVGGGPAPGINAVIAAATIEARNHGLRVLGCYDGFRWLVQGDTQHVVELGIDDVSRIHFEGGSILRTSRTNPTGVPDGVARVADTLQRMGVHHLITIGGDDTAYASSRLAKALPGLTVAHVPKTIDNDLPLPSDIVTFGFTTAVNLGKDLVRNLMQDASTTERWFFVTVMGRHAGHLALAIGGSAGATLTMIAEEFPGPRVAVDRLVDTLEGAIIKRRVHGREHGVAILSEGLAEKLDPETLGPVERDQYGNVRLAELELGRMLKERVQASLKSRGIDVTIVDKEMGYELRCAPPGAHDIQYCRSLGYWATRFLLEGGSNAMVTIQAGRLVPVPFGLMMDPKTGKIRVRYVDA
ncbi:MAG: 6-phosphofructokinase, partial [Candidatus Rokuibacteriota bacterium]